MSRSSRCVAFAGGGSGGHLFPGLAVAEALRQRHPDVPIEFYISRKAIDREIIAAANFPFIVLPLGAPKHGACGRMMFAGELAAATAFVTARWLPRRPAAVVGLGGFASAPNLWAAQLGRIPYLLLESNAIPGRATRWFAHGATAVCSSLGSPRDQLPGARTLETGNPVRPGLLTAASGDRSETSRFTLVVLGGSQGSQALNRAMMAAVKAGRFHGQSITILHQSGPHDGAAVRDVYSQAGIEHTVVEFQRDMAAWYAAADLVISRGGATSLAELAAVGLPTIVVPLPTAADDHQRFNAEWYATRGAARFVEQSSDPTETGARLAEAVLQLFHDFETRRRLATAIRATARFDAADRIVDELDRVLAIGSHVPASK